MLIDGFGRVIDYLRISITQRCNFRCKYCMPENGVKSLKHGDLLSYEEMFEFVKICLNNGIKKVRLTGGEPLVRKGVEGFVAMINAYKPNLDLSMTTNGYFLPALAQKLKDAGLKRLNISLDSLNPQKAAFIARADVLGEVLKGIETAAKLGFKIKLNSVILRGINDDEILNLLEFARSKGIEIRFIEFMENKNASDVRGLSRGEILAKIGAEFSLQELAKSPSSPASIFRLENGYEFGIIDPHKHDFCASCNRLRLSAEGLLIPCLYYESGRSIFEAMREKNIKKACEILDLVLREKPEKNEWGEGNRVSDRSFFETGG